MIKILHDHFTVEIPKDTKKKTQQDWRQRQFRDRLARLIMVAYFNGVIGVEQLEEDDRAFADNLHNVDLEEYEIRMYVVDQEDNRFDSWDPYVVASEIVEKFSHGIRTGVQFRLVREIERALANHTDIHVHRSPTPDDQGTR